jgi:hypothetical protein
VTGAASANGQPPALFDLEAAALAAEAESTPFAFVYKGHDYAVPPARVWPLSALRQIALGNLEAALPVLLGPDAFDQLTLDGLTLGELNLLFEQLGKQQGLDLPNSGPRAQRGSTRTSKRR